MVGNNSKITFASGENRYTIYLSLQSSKKKHSCPKIVIPASHLATKLFMPPSIKKLMVRPHPFEKFDNNRANFLAEIH
jgi:hypothetical protein